MKKIVLILRYTTNYLNGIQSLCSLRSFLLVRLVGLLLFGRCNDGLHIQFITNIQQYF